MTLCIYCSAPLPERAAFCLECGKTARCRACKDLLERNAKFCVSCGAQITSMNAASSESTTASTLNSYNLIEYEEDTKSRRFKAQVTDRAIDAVGEHFSLFLTRRAGLPQKRSDRSAGETSAPQYTDSTSNGLSEDPPEGEYYEIESQEPSRQSPRGILSASPDADQLKSVFQRNAENRLILINSRLKQKNQRACLARLSVLFTYADEIVGRDHIDRPEILSQLTVAKVLDSNARNWLKKTDLLAFDGDQVRLSIPGREFAKQILNEIDDQSIETKWSLGSKPIGRSRKQAGNDAKDSNDAKPSGTRTHRSQRGTGYRMQVRNLFDEGFFSSPRSALDVGTELKTRGHSFEKKRIGEVLVILAKENLLKRKQNEQGDWIYEERK